MSETRRVMVDIETVGLEIGSAIVQIGAVEFSPEQGVGNEFSRSVSLTSSQDSGLTVDAGTVEWWLRENPELAPDLLVGGVDLTKALADFVMWYEQRDPDEVWANSPAFDCEQLECAGEQVGVEMPWEYYQERDVRTLDSLPHNVEEEQDSVEHDALSDAKYQAFVAAQILYELDNREQSGGGSE